MLNTALEDTVIEMELLGKTDFNIPTLFCVREYQVFETSFLKNMEIVNLHFRATTWNC
jgi:hypothetical protein